MSSTAAAQHLQPQLPAHLPPARMPVRPSWPRTYDAPVTIRVKRDRHFAAYPLMRIALDGEFIGKVGPRQGVEFSGRGEPQSPDCLVRRVPQQRPVHHRSRA